MQSKEFNRNKGRWNRGSRKGFTLPELMLSVTIAGLITASAVFTINLWARSSMSLGNYADMSGSCRRALDIFASDVRMANGVSVSSSTSFTFTAYDASNSTVTVSYAYDADSDQLTRTYDGTRMVLLDDVDQFGFSYFDLNRNATTNALSVKEVQIEAILLKEVLTIANTDEIISARFMLRNRRVSS
jgi:prepilin-type N-terminal cleavage/methylation domain-containing protein